MYRLVRIPMLALLIQAVLVPCAPAQGPDESAIAGRVTDPSSAAVAGAAVSVSGPGLIGGARKSVTRGDGSYQFSALPAGSYDVTFEAPGFRVMRHALIRLRAGTTLTVDARLDVGGVTEATEVRGHSPLVDVRSAASPTHFDTDLLQSLPTSRWLPSVVNLTPGVAGDVAFGGSQGGNGMYVDGVDITNPQYQDAWGRFNFNWVQEVQIAALGASAEHGGFTGVSARNVIRSGGNRFTGLGEVWITRPSWVADNTTSLSESLQGTFNAYELLSRWDTSVQLGGPIARDRVWFFGGFQRVTEESRPAGYQWEGSWREKDPRGIFKISTAPSANTRLEGFVQGGPYTVIGYGIDSTSPMEAAWDLHQTQVAWNTRLTWTPGPRTLLEAQGGGMALTSSEDPHAPNTRSGPPPHYDLTTGIYSENVYMFYDQAGSKQTASVSLTHDAEKFLGGRHQLKVGAEFEYASSRDTWGTPGGVYYLDDDGAPYLAYVGGDGSARATTPRVSLYAQDEWRVSDRITLEPGVRVAFNRGRVPDGSTVFSTTPVSPRIGVAWDVGADHRTVVRAHVGRYHDPTFSSRISGVDYSDQSTQTLVAVLPDGSFEELESYPPSTSWGVDPLIRHSYVDQYVAGVERQLRTDLSVQVQYIRRNYEQFMGMIDTGSIWQPFQTRDTGADAVLGTSDDGGMLTAYRKTNPGNEFYMYTNPPEAYRTYDGVQIIGRKRESQGWQMQASYTWSRTMGTVGNHWHVNAARYDLGNPGSFVNPNEFVNADGRAPFDFTHEFKVLGSYRVPLWGGFLVSGVYRTHTGYAWTRFARVNVPGLNVQRIKVEPRGANRTDPINTLDLRAEKIVPLGGPWRLGIYVDVFNVGNQGVPNAETAAPIQQNSGPNYLRPLQWVDPRSVRLGFRLTF